MPSLNSDFKSESREILDRLVYIRQRLIPQSKKVKLDDDDPFANIFMSNQDDNRPNKNENPNDNAAYSQQNHVTQIQNDSGFSSVVARRNKGMNNGHFVASDFNTNTGQSLSLRNTGQQQHMSPHESVHQSSSSQMSDDEIKKTIEK